MSPACAFSVSSAFPPPLMNSPTSLSLALATIAGRSSPSPRTDAADRLRPARARRRRSRSRCRARAPWRPARGSSPTAPSRSPPAERTATLKTETRMTRRTSATDASRPGDGDGGGDQQDRPDRYGELDLGATAVVRADSAASPRCGAHPATSARPSARTVARQPQPVRDARRPAGSCRGAGRLRRRTPPRTGRAGTRPARAAPSGPVPAASRRRSPTPTRARTSRSRSCPPCRTGRRRSPRCGSAARIRSRSARQRPRARSRAAAGRPAGRNPKIAASRVEASSASVS